MGGEAGGRCILRGWGARRPPLPLAGGGAAGGVPRPAASGRAAAPLRLWPGGRGGAASARTTWGRCPTAAASRPTAGRGVAAAHASGGGETAARTARRRRGGQLSAGKRPRSPHERDGRDEQQHGDTDSPRSGLDVLERPGQLEQQSMQPRDPREARERQQQEELQQPPTCTGAGHDGGQHGGNGRLPAGVSVGQAALPAGHAARAGVAAAVPALASAPAGAAALGCGIAAAEDTCELCGARATKAGRSSWSRAYACTKTAPNGALRRT